MARASGYLLDLGTEGTDVQVAARLIQQARHATDHSTTAAWLREALALWRGQPLMDVSGLSWLDEQAEWLAKLRLEAVHRLVEARLALGEHAQLIPDLERLTRQHPYHEDLQGQLMLTLYRAGRPADALAAYQQFRRILGDDLGIDPSPPLRELEAAILRHDISLQPVPTDATTSASGSTPATVPSMRTVPAQLPLALATFSGRATELGHLDAVLARSDEAAPAVTIGVLSGTAGVGKTTLAVYWAHRVAHRFPGGQLYVNLRGFGPHESVVDAAVALRSFLDALGVPAQRIPNGLDERAALYRSTLAGRRMLVVLDNARDVEQVRPLLPGSSGCLVLVTSRSQLIPLVAVEGAHAITLDLLAAGQARNLLARRIGVDRVADEPQAVEDLITHCARLPLALAVAAAHAATRPRLSLAGLAAELRNTAAVLDTFHGGDSSTEIRTVFSWSYHALSSEAASLFRLLGLPAGPDITPSAAASLAGVPHQKAHVLLAELADAHLLSEHTPGRFALHDLLRAYAAERVHADHDEHDKHLAVRRFLDHYLRTAHVAAQLLDPSLVPITLPAAEPGVTAGNVPDKDVALAWFSAEYPSLIAAVRLAADAAHDAHAWRLAWALTTFLVRQGHWNDQVAVHHTGLRAARRLADPAGQAHTLHGLGLGFARSGRFDQAHPHLIEALEVFASVGDTISQAHVLESLTWLAERQDRLADALGHAQHAYQLVQGTSHTVAQARFLNAIGWCHALLGNPRQAVKYCEQALGLFLELDDGNGQAATWDSLGYTYRHLDDHPRAVACYQKAVSIYRQLTDTYNMALSLADLGETLDDAGDPHAARQAWHEALANLDQLGHPDAERIRAGLDRTTKTALTPADWNPAASVTPVSTPAQRRSSSHDLPPPTGPRSTSPLDTTKPA